jgi:hypothetical protein
MHYTLVFGLDGGGVMEDLELGLELGYWLRFVFLAY